MKLGLTLNLWRDASLRIPMDMVLTAEDVGFHSIWSAEAYGADALSPLAYIAGQTRRIKLATGIAQLAARPPATLAMHAMTIDALAGGGRVIIGLGVSGPQIVEGWYGQPWGKPSQRIRDYVAIVQKILDREEPATHDGTEISLPYRGPGALGQGKALKSILHPIARIPIWLAAGGPLNTELCAEVCDGWLPMGLPRNGVAGVHELLERGWARRGGRPTDFEIFAHTTIELTEDVAAAFDRMRPRTAMHIGGMGSASHNFHREAMARRGFAEDATRIQELWLAGQKSEAIAAVPDEYLDSGGLIGDEQRIRRRWDHIVEQGTTGVVVHATCEQELRLLADLAGT